MTGPLRPRLSLGIAPAAGLGALALCACSLLFSTDDLGGQDADASPRDAALPVDGGSTTDAGDGAPDADAAPAPGVRCRGTTAGPDSVDGGTFCIDATEVTVAQYNLFRDQADPSTGQPEVCAWNTTFVPRRCATENPVDAPDRPVVGVDWCDALAYCRWAGKRLCGKVGGTPLDPATRNNPTADEWYAACSTFGARGFPYGNAAVERACNTSDAGGTTAAVGSFAGCAGGIAENLRDMVGNAAEWVDDCTLNDGGPQGQSCRLRGGHYTTPLTLADCDYAAVADRNATLCEFGFRCCSGP